MAFSHGKLAVVKVDNAAGSLVDISSYATEASMPQEVEAAETTVFGLGTKQYIPGLGDATFSVSGPYDPTVNTLFTVVKAAVIAGTVLSSSIEYGPAGSTAGLPKYEAEGVLTSYEVSSSVGDPNEWSAEYQITGPVTATTWS